jgi:HK97 family phage major capsid protein/HK97 family phage prohead protease
LSLEAGLFMAEKLTREQIIKKATSETHKRSFVIERAKAVESADRTIELSFASDVPCPHFSYTLWDFIDVKLSIDPKSVRTERLENGMAVLMGHDAFDWRSHVGVVRSFSIDQKDGKIRAVVEFSDSTDGDQIYREVLKGIRQNVSVGFNIHKLVLEEENEEGNDLYRADDWEPFELSIVSIPADISVGVGRNAEFVKYNPQPEIKQMSKEIEMPESPANGKETVEVVERDAAEIKAIRNDQEIIEWAEIFGKGEMAREMLITSKSITLDDVRAKINDERARERELAKRVSPVRPVNTEAVTLGNALISSEEYRNIKPKANQKYSINVQTNILPSQLQRATYSGSGDGLTGYDRVPGIIELGQQPPTVADLFMQAQTDAPTVRYMREVSYTNAADWTTEGDEKPEASFDLEEVDASVRKAAVWSKVTDETLEDFSQIRPYIDQRLSFMLRTKIDSDLLNGTGTAPQIAGLLGTSGVQTQEMASNTAVELAIAIMKSITKVRTVGFFEPDAIVINPNDYEKLRLAVDGNTQFYGGGFFQGQYGNTYTDPDRIWGLRVVQTTAISEIDLATPGASNKGPIVGAFKLGGAVFYRNGLSIESTNTDQDDFIMNLTTIRVEQRLALAVYRPKAFCRVINAA